jgi:hypothetical protein
MFMTRFVVPIAMVLAAAALRLVKHPDNVAPVGALALFAGAVLPDRRLAFAVPLAAMFASDAIIGFHSAQPFVYGSVVVSVLLGRWLASSRRWGPVAVATLAGAVQFFVVTNFGHWLLWGPHTPTGFVKNYVVAVPFFLNTLAGDACYTAALFGGLALVESLSTVRQRAATRAVTD